MDYSKIVYVLEFNNDSAEKDANTKLEQGWLLISVGPKLTEILDNGQAYYSTAYVVGATAEQRDKHLKEVSNDLENLY
ncbi:hypothetical protein Hs30E_19520 [Lactococcus hodotermopsidis]|uniref:DUF1737 domain-containing protein n=1 Tax=Pseudolactococcus hodotermopsidis TaxID=2709157 RepID=A0A6A0BGK7_9LACT|nr:hypothetical protein [Lactococcus hodotermopsidis]GFH43401.1 hypothetical protein Hs30E_19520 [Lactococcus hodotermopsidis]